MSACGVHGMAEPHGAAAPWVAFVSQTESAARQLCYLCTASSFSLSVAPSGLDKGTGPVKAACGSHRGTWCRCTAGVVLLGFTAHVTERHAPVAVSESGLSFAVQGHLMKERANQAEGGRVVLGSDAMGSALDAPDIFVAMWCPTWEWGSVIVVSGLRCGADLCRHQWRTRVRHRRGAVERCLPTSHIARFSEDFACKQRPWCACGFGKFHARKVLCLLVRCLDHYCCSHSGSFRTPPRTPPHALHRYTFGHRAHHRVNV